MSRSRSVCLETLSRRFTERPGLEKIRERLDISLFSVSDLNSSFHKLIFDCKSSPKLVTSYLHITACTRVYAVCFLRHRLVKFMHLSKLTYTTLRCRRSCNNVNVAETTDYSSYPKVIQFRLTCNVNVL